MITELMVINFQIHQKKTLFLKKGVNVIIGDTDAGKSAIIRALYMLIMNQPRSGERIFQNKYDSKTLTIQIKDDRHNIIKRVGKKYYLNGSLMKAIGTDIPAPVVELLPFKDINWQKQLDPHFLVLQTGGGAAKILNASSGMEDQETIMKMLKSDISDHKSNIKHFIANNKECHETIVRLKPVVRLMMQAKSVKSLQRQSDQLNNEIVDLNKLIKDIETYQIDPEIYVIISDISSAINQVESKTIESNQLDSSIKQIHSLITQLKDVQKVAGKSLICNKLIHSTNLIIAKAKRYDDLQIMIKHLTNIIDQIEQATKNRKHYQTQLERIENEFYQNLWDAGQCPYCGTEFDKKGHVC